MAAKPLATVSIDLDELWAYRASFGLADNGERLLHVALPRFMATMAEAGLRGTAFVVGRDAQDVRTAAALRELAASGHELGNHSWQHASELQDWPPERQHEDLAMAHRSIAAASGGLEPVGFRAPAFCVSPSLLHTVQRLGYAYDSSSFPNALAGLAQRWQRARTAKSEAASAPSHGAATPAFRSPLVAHRWRVGNEPDNKPGLLEIPITTLPLLRVPLHGTYVQHLADRAPRTARAYCRAAFALCAARGVAPHLLLHATDFIGADDGLDVAFLPGMRRPWRAKQALVHEQLSALKRHFDPATLRRYADWARQRPLAVRTPVAPTAAAVA